MTWTRFELGTTAGICTDIAIQPDNSEIVFAAGPPNLHKSTDGGITWNALTNGISGTIHTVTVNSVHSNIIYAGGEDGLFKSMNEGMIWFNTGLSDVNTVLVEPFSDDTIYAGTDSGIYRSTDGCGTWMFMNEGLEDLRVTSLGVAPANYLFAGTDGSGMYRWAIDVGISETRHESMDRISSIFPNPAHGNVTIEYEVHYSSRVTLALYDIQGRLIRRLIDTTLQPGKYSSYWDRKDKCGRRIPCGVYFCRLTTNEHSCINRITVIKH